MSAFANPVLPMVTTLVADELHPTLEVMSLVLPSLKVPVAMNCWLLPTMIVAPLGVTAIVIRAGVTLKLAVPRIESNVAVILDWPGGAPGTKPPPRIVRTVFAEEFHVTPEGKFFFLP